MSYFYKIKMSKFVSYISNSSMLFLLVCLLEVLKPYQTVLVSLFSNYSQAEIIPKLSHIHCLFPNIFQRLSLDLKKKYSKTLIHPHVCQFGVIREFCNNYTETYKENHRRNRVWYFKSYQGTLE